MGWHTSTILKHIANNPKMPVERRNSSAQICAWLERGMRSRCDSFQDLHRAWFDSLPWAAGLPGTGFQNRDPHAWRPTHDTLVEYAHKHEIPEDWDHTGGA